MNVTTWSGIFSTFQDVAGFGTSGGYNGVLGVTFDRTEQYNLLCDADGKQIRKLNYRTTYVSSDITNSNGCKN